MIIYKLYICIYINNLVYKLTIVDNVKVVRNFKNLFIIAGLERSVNLYIFFFFFYLDVQIDAGLAGN